MADPKQLNFTIVQGTKFGPVDLNFGPLEEGESIDVDDVIVRIQQASGNRDSTVDNEEIVIDGDSATWTMLEDETAELVSGRTTGEVIVIESDGQDRVVGLLAISVRSRLGSPSA